MTAPFRSLLAPELRWLEPACLGNRSALKLRNAIVEVGKLTAGT
jgi:hypothetical protein